MNALAPPPQVKASTIRVLITTAANARFRGFLRSLVTSLAPALARGNIDLACFDIGLDPADIAWLGQHAAMVMPPRTHLGIEAGAHSVARRSFLARPFLREYFPGYDVYVWIDSDIWLQDSNVIDTYISGALTNGMAIAHENERSYTFQPWLFGWTAKHFLLGYGPLTAAHLLAKPHVNAGFFALAADAPQWDGWARRYEAAIRRTGALVPHDQFALNHTLYAREGRYAPARFLDPSCNWICDRGVPMWDDTNCVYCKPYPPYPTIAALHLAGPAKDKIFTVRRTGGGAFESAILLGTSPARPARQLSRAVPA